jgi:hypothetical protein
MTSALKALFESMGVRVVAITPHPYDAERCRMADMTDADVKKLWDAYDGCNAPLGISGEAVHFELNMRGCGEYCAV